MYVQKQLLVLRKDAVAEVWRGGARDSKVCREALANTVQKAVPVSAK